MVYFIRTPLSLVDLCLKTRQVDRAFGVIRDMRERSLPLNEVTYTSLIHELTQLGQLERIVEVVLEEPHEGIPLIYSIKNFVYIPI
jgi:pentatricopeptide repeat protein